jgi:chromosome segregation ATPase
MASSGNGKRLTQQLLDLKDRIEKAKSQRSEMQGELKSIRKQLKDNYSIESIEDATAMLDEMEQRLESLEKDIQDKVEEAETLLDQEDV